MKAKRASGILLSLIVTFTGLACAAQNPETLTYRLEHGSTFTPLNGRPVKLTGTFEWVAFDIGTPPDVGMEATALHLQAGDLVFTLNTSAANNAATGLFRPGNVSNFYEFVDVSHKHGTVFDSAARLYSSGYFVGPIQKPYRVVYPSMYVQLSSGIVGYMSFSAVLVSPLPLESASSR